jgi:hypothetical protein
VKVLCAEEELAHLLRTRERIISADGLGRRNGLDGGERNYVRVLAVRAVHARVKAARRAGFTLWLTLCPTLCLTLCPIHRLTGRERGREHARRVDPDLVGELAVEGFRKVSASLPVSRALLWEPQWRGDNDARSVHTRVGPGRGRPAVLRLDLAPKRRDIGRAAGVTQRLLNGRQGRIRLGETSRT